MSLPEQAPGPGARFLDGGGASARLVAELDWSRTSVGPIAGWPASLKTAVGLVVRSPAAMALLWGADGTLIYNDGYALIAGDRHPAALGAKVGDIWPEAASFNAEVLQTVLQGGSLTYRDQSFELMRHGQLAKAWFRLDYSPVLDESDTPAGVIAVIVETTEKVLAETWLRGEQERLRQMFDQSPGFMAMLRGPEHVFDLVNPAYLQLVGHRPVVGLTVRDALPDIAGQGFFELLDQVYGSGEAHSGRAVAVTFQRDEGGSAEQRFVDFVFQPVTGPGGSVLGVFIQGVDVTDRIAAEAEIRSSEARNRQILDSAIDYAIVAFDRDGKVTRWNEGARRILGWTEAEMLGQDAACFFTPEDRASGRMQLEMQLALSRGAANDERWHVRKSGERFWANGEMSPILDDAGRPTGFVKVLRDRTEQHQAAQALRQSEARLRRAQEAGGVGTFTVELSSGRLFGTPEFFRIFGLPEAASVRASDVEALVVPEDAELRSRSVTRGTQTAPLDVEYRIRRANDGALRWISRKAEYERSASGEAVSMVGAVLDITERRAAQAALEASAAQFRTFAQTLPSHVWTAPPDGMIDWFNDRVYEYSGAAQGELDGEGWAQIVHPEDIAGASAQWLAALASGEDYETEFRVRRADGTYRWHLVRAVALRSADGTVHRWVGTNTDIHERKLAEAQSARDRDRIWTLSQELMLVCDLDGIIAAVNPSATRLLGWSDEEMIGQTLADFVHPDDLPRTEAEIARLTDGATTLAFENRYRSKDGSYRILDWAAVPDGGYVHGVARDVTRERLAEDSLRQSQKMEAVGQLTGGVAHDFNNLLTIIRTSVDLMLRPQTAEDRRTRLLGSISNAVNRAAKLTGQLLAFARRQALQPVAFDATQSLRAVGEMIGALVGARIVVEILAPPEPCVIHADPSQFDTAIVNMAVNARDAMAGAGRLTIEIGPVAAIPALRAHPAVSGAFVAVSLTDSGAGIDPAHVERIFEPFFTTKAVGLGTGLGLSQVFGFAKQSGGDIRVLSRRGQGSTFTLYLPSATLEADASLSAEPAEPVAQPEGRGACILVVEDNLEVARSAEDSLHELGYTTVLAHSAAEALTVLDADAQRFAAVFSDVVMLGMDGIALAHEIRRRHAGLALLLASGYSDVLAKDDAHGFALLPKPYSIEELSKALAAAMGGPAGGAPARPPARMNALRDSFAVPDAARETLRLGELASMKILDSEEEAAFDDLTRMAADFCGAPVALISLIDGERQWFKSRVGTQARETPREHAFCAHAIQAPEQVMVVNDATRDARFTGNPLVDGNPGIRFYAGAPLVTSEGHALGTICVIDYQPREIEPRQLEMLQFLAAQVVKRMEQRRLELDSPDKP